MSSPEIQDQKRRGVVVCSACKKEVPSKEAFAKRVVFTKATDARLIRQRTTEKLCLSCRDVDPVWVMEPQWR
jgi:hypothetical protein